MLLRQLEQYADGLHLPPRLYGETAVRYIIDLKADGSLASPQPIDTADPSSPRTKRGARRLTPTIQRTSIKPLLLADKADYVLGFVSSAGKPERVRQCHDAFTDLVDRCAMVTEEPTVLAVRSFIKNEPLSQLRIGDDFDPSGIMTFRVDGIFPIDLPSVQAFWATEHDPEKGMAPPMQCIVCGQVRPALERLELKVKGVPGGQTAGTSIISFNADAFESYGLKASLNAPSCASCGERFTKALNYLLASEDSRIRLSDIAYVFWTKEPQADLPFAALLNQPDPQQVKALYESVFAGKQGATKLDDTAFYAAALSGSGGRAVVRDWIDTTVGSARQHLARWFALQRITAGSEVAPPLGLRQLAAATVRTGDFNNPPPPNVSRLLLRNALTGAPLPHDLLFQCVRRNRAEQGVSRSRAALIKMVLLSQLNDTKEEDMVELDETNRDPGYLCGRLLAVLEQTQRDALPGINATIVDRFYGTASSAPASVFGRLIRGAQPHLGRLERDKRGAWVNLQRKLEEIQSGLVSFPTTLTLQQQGLFALGYYHERARRFAKKDDGAQEKDSDSSINDEDQE